MPHASRERLAEMSSSPRSISASISLRRLSGWRNSARSVSSVLRNGAYLLSRKNQLRSSTHSSVRVGCSTHLPSMISASCLNASQPTQYQPSYAFS